jgi:hypothetical protein
MSFNVSVQSCNKFFFCVLRKGKVSVFLFNSVFHAAALVHKATMTSADTDCFTEGQLPKSSSSSMFRRVVGKWVQTFYEETTVSMFILHPADRGSVVSRKIDICYYITLLYITLHYITLHYITLHYITLHYITLHYITLHYITRLWILNNLILSTIWASHGDFSEVQIF